jgi:orotate phosphoribosyltransferase
MDRMERAGSDGQLSPHSAVQEVQLRYGLPVVTIASLDDILTLLEQNAEFARHRDAVLAYRAQYGIQ